MVTFFEEGLRVVRGAATQFIPGMCKQARKRLGVPEADMLIDAILLPSQGTKVGALGFR